MKQYIILINGRPMMLVHKRDTFKNLAEVAKGRKWAGKWYGIVKSKGCLFNLEEAKAMVAKLETLNGKLGGAFTSDTFTYEIEEVEE